MPPVIAHLPALGPAQTGTERMAEATDPPPPVIRRTPGRVGPLAPLLTVLLAAAPAGAQPPDPGRADEFTGRPRVVVLSDIGNEPDDQMSFVRLLLYSNELDLEALIATTSTWQKNKVQPDTMRKLIAAYGEAQSNLLKHASGWPEAGSLDALVAYGQR